ncbi:MAG: cell division protein ZapA [Novosphingobium sp.]|nr:cell division protein ZapA [Novosphingobium sp.]
MSNLTLAVAGRAFTVSCADGEESHVEMLGRMIDERARKVGIGQNETRTLLFAALMLADELHDAHRSVPAAPEPAILPPPPVPAVDDKTIERVNVLAERLEKLVLALEQGPVNA